jgi:chromosome segregation ATPase
MALPRVFKRDLNNDRGLDPRAMATLQAKQNSRAKREDDLKRKQTEREINALKARLSVVDREIQRLSVSERRYQGDESRVEQDFERESRSLDELTKELGRHSEKVKSLQDALNAKKLLSHRMQVSNDFGREAADKENDRLKNELKRVDQEIDQLNSKRRRLVAEMTGVQQKIQRAYELENKEQTELKENQNEINKILQELQSEESVIGRFKARFSTEQKTVLEKQKQLADVKRRMQGASSGSPALESERDRIEKKIRDLEQTLN